MEQPYRINTVVSRVMQSLVLVYQAIAALIFVASLFLAYDWLKNPFIGGFFEQTMVLNDIDTTEPGEHWALYEQGFNTGDQLVSVDGQIISNAQDLDTVLGSHRVGQKVSVTIRPDEGPERTVDITLHQPVDLWLAPSRACGPRIFCDDFLTGDRDRFSF